MQCDLLSVSFITNSCESFIQSPQRKLVFQPSRAHLSSLGKEPWITPEKKKKHAKPWQRTAHITGAIVSLLVFACMSEGVCPPSPHRRGWWFSQWKLEEEGGGQVWWKEGGHTRSDMHLDTKKETINVYFAPQFFTWALQIRRRGLCIVLGLPRFSEYCTRVLVCPQQSPIYPQKSPQYPQKSTTHTYIHTNLFTYLHTCIYTYMHTYTHKHDHTHTHTHTDICSSGSNA